LKNHYFLHFIGLQSIEEEASEPNLEAVMAALGFDLEQLRARFWYKQYEQQWAENTELRTQLNYCKRKLNS
jgi:hypothetical protein